VCVLLPMRAMQAHDFVSPYVNASNAISKAPTDVVIVDESRLLFAEDLARNGPFLRNRPKERALTELTKSYIATLSSRHSVSLFGYDQAIALGIAPNERATMQRDALRTKLRKALSQQSCGVDLVVSTK